MLMMSRREGESILIGDDIEIVIAQIARNRVKLGIRAPRDTMVIAREIKLVRDENVKAATGPRTPVALSGLIASLQPARKSPGPNPGRRSG